MMLGYLLARAGIDVVVLEKHADFLRDFRGDTIHPSTMQIMWKLGLLDEFLKLPHQPVRDVSAYFGDEKIEIADFSRLPVQAPYIAMMPQWDFLNFMAEKAKAFPNFRLLMRTEATRLVIDGNRCIGLKARTDDGEITIRSQLVVAADGRDSAMRKSAGLTVEDFGAPMDVLWFRLSRAASDTSETQARFFAGGIMIMLDRGDYWQCAFVIPKGENKRVRAAGLEAFRNRLVPLLPVDASRADELQDWDQVKLLVVQVNRLKSWWRPNFLCIGDAAHAMSPVGGVGVNLAVQDAVAAANILTEPLRTGTLSDAHLQAVQKRREWPAKATQFLQLQLQKRVIASVLGSTRQVRPPLFLRLLTSIPFLRRLPARLVGLGVQPELPKT
jgi:2-polyprenyl-6-methoxyphenol hydroxylase-like FAD-dependent oxidoreductase